MTLIYKLCELARHPFRRPIYTEIQLKNSFHRTRYYICQVCGEVVREETT